MFKRFRLWTGQGLWERILERLPTRDLTEAAIHPEGTDFETDVEVSPPDVASTPEASESAPEMSVELVSEVSDTMGEIAADLALDSGCGIL